MYRACLILLLVFIPLAIAQEPEIAPAQSDAVTNQIQVVLQRAMALRSAQLAVHATIAAAANPLVPPNGKSPPVVPVQSLASPDFTLPPVPTTVSPIVQWLMGLASAVLTVGVPLLIAFLKQHFNLQAVATRAALINGSVTRAAGGYVEDRENGVAESLATMAALDYVKESHPDVIAQTRQATDQHLTESIKTEAARLVRTAPTTVVQQPAASATPAAPPIYTTRPGMTKPAS